MFNTTHKRLKSAKLLSKSAKLRAALKLVFRETRKSGFRFCGYRQRLSL